MGWDTEVAAETNSVSVPIADKRFNSVIRGANTLFVEGAGATIRIPLDRSLEALQRLDECLESSDLKQVTIRLAEPERQSGG